MGDEAAGNGGLAGIRVVEIAEQIAGPYCGKLFVDAGAEVVKIEPPGGDSLRRWSATGTIPAGEDSALFTYLNAGKRSLIGTAAAAQIAALIGEADLVVGAWGLATDGQQEPLDVASLRAAHPRLVVLSITPYGTAGPWAGRLASELTLQAESGSIGMRGVMGHEPYQAGGRMTEWAAGAYGAAAALAAVFRARAAGPGEHVDLSMLEIANTIFTNFSETMNRLMNGSAADPEHAFLAPVVETPSIEPTADGYVGFCTNSRQQFADFLLMIGRPDLREDEELAQFAGRLMRFAEWSEIVQGWTKSRTTAEIVELASALRIPVAPVGNGATVLENEHLRERGVFQLDASGRFRQPRRPYRIDDDDPPRSLPAPRLGEDAAAAAFHGAATAKLPAADFLPLAGVRIIDMTAWWAGPSASHILATLGAQVIHVEATARPDAMRMIGGMMAAHYDEWWEASPHFLHANSNKLGITLDLNSPRGREMLEKLAAVSDAILENFTPRVLENFGLDWQRVKSLNPRIILMRMTAFGLTGPWRDRTAFAQTMEQLTGMAWTTGHPDDQPRIPRGPVDPIAGLHSVFAFLVALAQRARDGRGHHVESVMVETALNVAAEQIVEWSAYRRLMSREGNRSSAAAPQGLYPCAGGQPGAEQWLAISIPRDEQWRALREAMGEPEWACDPALDSLAGRRAAHDDIDEHLRAWTRAHDRDGLARELRERGVPASPVADPSRLLQTNPQLRARRYFETPQHPVVGAMPLPSLPFRYASIDHWLRTPAPTMGRDNEEVLGGILGLSAGELRELDEAGVIGKRPKGL